jgi:phage-related protein
MQLFERLIYTNERGASVEFSPRSLFHTNIKDVLGLSDVRNTNYMTSSAGQDGDTFISGRIERREIEIVGNIKAKDKTEIHTLRRELNRTLNPQYSGTLTYSLGDFNRVIDCRINSAPVFRRGVIFEQFTVRLVCPNPFWRELDIQRDDIAAWIGGMEFDSDSGLELNDDWQIGYLEPQQIMNIYNAGDVSASVIAEFRALGTASNPQLTNIKTGEFMKFNVNLSAGDMLTVNTGYGEKRATITQGGTTSDALQYLDVDSTFVQLSAGDNLYQFSADTNEENIECTVRHNNNYLGV